MSQDTFPFFESAEAATKAAVQASGKTPKQVGGHLWPERSAEAAQTAYLNAVNENRSERLTADQHAAVANYCRQYHWLYYVAMKCNHDRPRYMAPEALAAERQAKVLDLLAQLKPLMAHMDLGT